MQRLTSNGPKTRSVSLVAENSTRSKNQSFDAFTERELKEGMKQCLYPVAPAIRLV